MPILLFVIKRVFLILLDLLDLAMLIRAIMSWIDPMGGGKLASFLYTVTEPIILPFRRLLAKLRLGEGSFLDIPFLLALLTLTLLRAIVGSL